MPPYHEASANTVWECQHGKPIYKCQARWGAPEVSLGGMATVHCVPLSFKQNNLALRGPIASPGLSFLFDEICEPALGLYHNKHTKKNWHPSVRMNRKRPKKYLKRVLVLDHYGMESSRVLHQWVRICAVTSKKTSVLLVAAAWDCENSKSIGTADVSVVWYVLIFKMPFNVVFVLCPNSTPWTFAWLCSIGLFPSHDDAMTTLSAVMSQDSSWRLARLGFHPSLSNPGIDEKLEEMKKEGKRQLSEEMSQAAPCKRFYLFKLETLGESKMMDTAQVS